MGNGHIIRRAPVRYHVGIMPAFDSDGVQIRYETWGEGEPIVLVHGFASSLKGNWVDTGWVDELSKTRRVVALDCRGHGESDKPHDPAMYGSGTMAEDVVRLMDHLSIESADLMGYSMGGYISLMLLTRHGERFTRAVLGGIGSPSSPAARGRPNVVEALLAESAAGVTDPVGRAFRIFAEANKNDLRALAACMQAGREPLTPEMLGAISIPVLVVVGSADALIAKPEELAHAIPNAELVTIPGKDHITVAADRRFKEAVLQFLAG